MTSSAPVLGGALSGKVAVVTGAARGIGRATAVAFADAGIQAFKPLLEMGDEDWEVQIDTNLTGTANAIRSFAPYLVKRGSGRIIVTSSTQGRHGTLNGAAYSASKWGIIGLMKPAALIEEAAQHASCG